MIPVPVSLRGPLGSHQGYITHIALANYVEYLQFKKTVEEKGDAPSQSVKYEEFRLFLNAAESMNNTPEYLYWEHATSPTHQDGGNYLGRLRTKFPVLKDLSNLVNAYKHCDRSEKGERSARDLQQVFIQMNISLSQPQLSKTEFHFAAPLAQDEATADAAFKFWLEYHQSNYTKPTTAELVNV